MSYNPRDPSQNWLPDYVRLIADKFALKDWAFRVQEENPHGKKNMAEVSYLYGMRCAQVWVADGFWELEPMSQRYYIVHELLHCHLASPDVWAERHMKTKIYQGYLDLLELSIDGIADGVTSGFSMPPKKKRTS